MKNIKDIVSKREFPVRILQFGEGNFLRAFADYMVSQMNTFAGFNATVCACNLRKSGSVEKLTEQNCIFTLISQGLKNGAISTEIMPIDSIGEAINPYLDYSKFSNFSKSEDWRFVISNSTEAGIVFNCEDKFEDEPPSTYPAKLTKLLFERFKFFKGDKSKGIIIIPCELLEKNGDSLKECVLKYVEKWNLGASFVDWLNSACAFCNTLVDRIVSGYPSHISNELEKLLDYKDSLAVVAEPYLLWAIQAPEFAKKELPFNECNLNVVFTDDIAPYRAQKVTLLNAPHTLMSAMGLQMNIAFVMDAVLNPVLGKFISELIFNELILTLDLPEDALKIYAKSVLDRFKNPYLKHQLKSISSNAISKSAVRVVPPLKKYFERKHTLPSRIVFGLCANAIMAFNDKSLLPANASQKLKDEKNLLEFSKLLFSSAEIFGENLLDLNGFENSITEYIESISKSGMENSIKKYFA